MVGLGCGGPLHPRPVLSPPVLMIQGWKAEQCSQAGGWRWASAGWTASEPSGPEATASVGLRLGRPDTCCSI